MPVENPYEAPQSTEPNRGQSGSPNVFRPGLMQVLAGWHSLNRLCCGATRSKGLYVEFPSHADVQKSVRTETSCA